MTVSLRLAVTGSMSERELTVIVINGAPQSGKDTFVQMFKKLNDAPVGNINAADKVKSVMRRIGWDGRTKDEETRNMMALMQDYAIKHGDIPTTDMIIKVNNFYIEESAHKDHTAIFVHIRKKSEIDKFIRCLRVDWDISHYVGKLKIIKLLIRRDGVDVACNSHDAEAAKANDCDYDVVINNNSTLDDLQKHVVRFIDDILYGGTNG